MKTLLYFVLLLIAPSVSAQHLEVKKNLRSAWSVYQQERYTAYDSATGEISTIYIMLEPHAYAGNKLSIESRHALGVFINGKLAGTGRNFLFDLDSIYNTSATHSFQLALHGRKIDEKSLQTTIKGNSDDPVFLDYAVRKASSFKDFAIIGLMILMILVATIVRLNAKLASDYFSVTKIFSMREADDLQMHSRITSSTNILFYVYCSLMLSYFLMLVFHYVPSRYSVALAFQGDSFLMIVGLWLKLSFIVLSVFFVKIILVFGLSYLFGITEIAGVHFFNWVRVLFVFLGVLTIISFLYFITHGSDINFLAVLLQIFGWTLGIWMVLIFLKLNGSIQASMFHLFSYICATELIPFLITIKVLYN